MKAHSKVSRIISVITIAAMMIMTFTGITPKGAYAATEVAYAVTGGNIYFDKDSGKITGCDDTVTEAVIPAEIDGAAVTKIGQQAFYQKTSLTNVVMADSITEIGISAFNRCSALKHVKLSSNLRIIDSFAFWICSELEAIDLPPNLKEIRGGAFTGCTFSAINIPDSLTYLGHWELSCTDMTEVTLPESLQTVSTEAFRNFESLKNIYVKSGNSSYKSVDGVLYSANGREVAVYPQARPEESYEIPDGVERIESFAFYYSKNLKNIKIPDSVARIGNSAFAYTGITAVEIPDMVTEIDMKTFLGCKSLKAVKLPASLKNISEQAFHGCAGLEEIIVPEGTARISMHAFGSTGLKKITLPASITALSAPFEGCTILKTAPSL